MTRAAALISIAIFLAACEQPLTLDGFQRQAERVYSDVNAGFGVGRRDGTRSFMARGDQVFILDTKPLFEDYKASKRSASDWFDDWRLKLEQEAKSRRKTLEAAKEEVIPILKSGVWIRVQDLGAIGPRNVQDQIRPWRKQIAEDVFVLLGVREELLGYRYVSLHEVEASNISAEDWLTKSIANLSRLVGTATGSVELKRDDGRLMVLDMPNKDGISGLILDKEFRKKMLAQFQSDSLGASVPNRDVLIVFDPEDFVTIKPIRARTHQLYDERNHPGFRGLLRFDADKISVMEPGRPPQAAPQP